MSLCLAFSLVPVPLHFSSVALVLENVCVSLYFIKGFHSCCFRVPSCCYIFSSVPLERADRWKMTTPWVNQSNALHLPGNILLSGAQTNQNFYFVFGSDVLSATHHKCKEKQLTASEFFTWWIRMGVIAVVLYFYEVTIPLSTSISEISLHLRLFVNFHFISTKLFTDCTLWAIFHHRGEKKPEMSREIVWNVSCWSREEALVLTCVLSALRLDSNQTSLLDKCVAFSALSTSRRPESFQ